MNTQVKQLKLNVTNIKSILVKTNEEREKTKKIKKQNKLRLESIRKKEEKEEKIELSSPNTSIKSTFSKIKKVGGNIFDKLLNFGSLLLLGILANSLPAIAKKIVEVVDDLVDFLTPLYSGFILLQKTFNGEPLDDPQLNPEKKRFTDELKKVKLEVDKLKENLGIGGFIITPLQNFIDGMIKDFGGDRLVMATKTETDEETGEKKVIEGFLDTKTGDFIEKQFTAAERERYEEARRQRAMESPEDAAENAALQESVRGQTSEGSSTGPASSGTTLNYGLVNPTPNTNILENKGGYAADTGLDIIGKVGDPIVSPVDGILEYAERGHTVQMGQDSDPTKPGIQDQLSFRIRLNKPFTFDGKKVNFVYGTHLATLDAGVANKFDIPIKAGQRLGTMGVANNVPHLHIGFVEDRAQTGFLNFKEVRRLLSGQSSNGEKKGAAGLLKGSRDERNKQMNAINQPDPTDEEVATLFIQRVNTIQYVPVPVTA